MEEMMVLALAFGGALLSGTFGFGSSLIVVGVGSFFLPVKTLIPLVTLLLLNPIVRTFLYRKGIPWGWAWKGLVASLPGVIVGYQFFTVVPERALAQLVGVVILFSGFFSWFQERRHLVRFKEIILWRLWGVHFLSGFFSGAGAGGSPLRIISNQSLRLSKEAFMALAAIQSVAIGSVKLGLLFDGNYLAVDQWFFYLQIMVLGIIGNLSGRYFLRRMCPKSFRLAIWILLAVVGLKMILVP